MTRGTYFGHVAEHAALELSLAFGGFEGAAPLAEEARDPRRTIPRAVLLATLGIGLLYVFTTYAVDVAFRQAGFAGFGSSGPASWEGMARSLYGLFWFFVFLARSSTRRSRTPTPG